MRIVTDETGLFIHLRFYCHVLQSL